MTEVLSHLTALESFLSFLGSIGAIMLPILLRVRAELKRNEDAMKSVPPSELPVESNADLEAENQRLRGEVHRLQWRIEELSLQLTEVGRDHGHTARALTREREECEMLRLRVGELKETLRAVNSGASTHLPTHPLTRGSSPSLEAVHVTEIDDRPTPRLGMKRVRREPQEP